MQIYCPIFLDLEGKQYICTQQYTEVQKDLLRQEKDVSAAHVAEKGGEGPWELPMLQVKCALYRLEKKRTDLLHRQLR